MTPARAKELRIAYMDQLYGFKKVKRESPAEREEVKKIWAEMPGSTCYLDALTRIEKGWMF